jgi:hypothetical protein
VVTTYAAININQRQLEATDYFREENRVPREQLSELRLRFTDPTCHNSRER